MNVLLHVFKNVVCICTSASFQTYLVNTSGSTYVSLTPTHAHNTTLTPTPKSHSRPPTPTTQRHRHRETYAARTNRPAVCGVRLYKKLRWRRIKDTKIGRKRRGQRCSPTCPVPASDAHGEKKRGKKEKIPQSSEISYGDLYFSSLFELSVAL